MDRGDYSGPHIQIRRLHLFNRGLPDHVRLRAQQQQRPSQFKRIIQHVELQQLVEERVLARLEHKLDQHRLLRGLQWDGILEHAAQELQQDRVHVSDCEGASPVQHLRVRLGGDRTLRCID